MRGNALAAGSRPTPNHARRRSREKPGFWRPMGAAIPASMSASGSTSGSRFGRVRMARPAVAPHAREALTLVAAERASPFVADDTTAPADRDEPATSSTTDGRATGPLAGQTVIRPLADETVAGFLSDERAALLAGERARVKASAHQAATATSLIGWTTWKR